MSIGGKELFYFGAFLKKFVKSRFRLVLCVGVGLRKPQARPRKVCDDMAKAKFRAERLAGLDGRYYRIDTVLMSGFVIASITSRTQGEFADLKFPGIGEYGMFLIFFSHHCYGGILSGSFHTS